MKFPQDTVKEVCIYSPYPAIVGLSCDSIMGYVPLNGLYLRTLQSPSAVTSKPQMEQFPRSFAANKDIPWTRYLIPSRQPLAQPRPIDPAW